MKINYTPQVMKAVKTYKKQAAKTEQMTKTSFVSDKIEISSSAKSFQAAFSKIKSSPDVRQDLVDGLKAKIESGEYHVKAEDIVEAMVQ